MKPAQGALTLHLLASQTTSFHNKHTATLPYLHTFTTSTLVHLNTCTLPHWQAPIAHTTMTMALPMCTQDRMVRKQDVFDNGQQHYFCGNIQCFVFINLQKHPCALCSACDWSRFRVWNLFKSQISSASMKHCAAPAVAFHSLKTSHVHKNLFRVSIGRRPNFSNKLFSY